MNVHPVSMPGPWKRTPIEAALIAASAAPYSAPAATASAAVPPRGATTPPASTASSAKAISRPECRCPCPPPKPIGREMRLTAMSAIAAS